MQLHFLNEFQLTPKHSIAINTLLSQCFTNVDYKGRDYYKQLPHYRILAQENEKVIGQVGLDLRVMNLNGHAINVLGVIDLCVDPTHRGRGIGTALMQELERIAQQHPHKIDFLFLVSDTPSYYEALGYTTTKISTTWLKLHQHKNYGVGTETITDTYFLTKAIGERSWEDGTLDLLGYLY